MTNLIERLRVRYMDTKQMLPCALEHEAAAEIERLTAERDTAYDMSRCQCGTDEACSNLAALRREIAALQAKHDDDKSDLLAMQRERDALQAKIIATALRDNPQWLGYEVERDEIERLRNNAESLGRDVIRLEAERESLRDMLDNALLIVRDFATRNPKHMMQLEQDPWGAHRWLDEYAARRGTT